MRSCGASPSTPALARGALACRRGFTSRYGMRASALATPSSYQRLKNTFGRIHPSPVYALGRDYKSCLAMAARRHAAASRLSALLHA